MLKQRARPSYRKVKAQVDSLVSTRGLDLCCTLQRERECHCNTAILPSVLLSATEQDLIGKDKKSRPEVDET